MVSTKPESSAPPLEPENAFTSLFNQLDGLEIETVRRNTKRMEIGILRGFVLGLNHLSNGMLYPIVAVVIFLIFGRAMTPTLGVAAVSVVVAHICYPIVKSHFARNRPFVRDPSIPSLLKPLDQYSFPSGHTMTATAAFIPICMTLPSLAFAGATGVLLIGWARLGAGHHYPSDVLAGIMLGGVCASPGLIWLLA